VDCYMIPAHRVLYSARLHSRALDGLERSGPRAWRRGTRVGRHSYGPSGKRRLQMRLASQNTRPPAGARHPRPQEGFFSNLLARIMHETPSRDRGDGRATGQPQGLGPEAYLSVRRKVRDPRTPGRTARSAVAAGGSCIMRARMGVTRKEKKGFCLVGGAHSIF